MKIIWAIKWSVTLVNVCFLCKFNLFSHLFIKHKLTHPVYKCLANYIVTPIDQSPMRIGTLCVIVTSVVRGLRHSRYFKKKKKTC